MKLKQQAHLIGALLLSLLATACSVDTAASSGPHDECLVCKKNADLACVDVAVTSKTPTYMYNGQTYYFCSDECKTKFEKDPLTYLKK